MRANMRLRNGFIWESGDGPIMFITLLSLSGGDSAVGRAAARYDSSVVGNKRATSPEVGNFKRT